MSGNNAYLSKMAALPRDEYLGALPITHPKDTETLHRFYKDLQMVLKNLGTMGTFRKSMGVDRIPFLNGTHIPFLPAQWQADPCWMRRGRHQNGHRANAKNRESGYSANS